MTDRQGYRLAEVAALLGVGQRTVRRWARDGTIRSVRIGRVVQVPAAELDRLLDTRDRGDEAQPATTTTVTGQRPRA